VKGNKNDFVDAEAICEAASRPSMRFVTPKSESQQALSALHRVRESLIRDRTKTVNQIHDFLLEFGISLPIARLSSRVCRLCLPNTAALTPDWFPRTPARHFKYLSEQLGKIEKEMVRQFAHDNLGQRLLSIPGATSITASVLDAEMGDGQAIAIRL